MNITRRAFMGSAVVAATPLPEATAKAPYMSADLSNLQYANGVLPFEGERVQVFKNEPPKGLFIGEAEYRNGAFYRRDFTLPDMPFTDPIVPDSWNTEGLRIPQSMAGHVVTIKTLVSKRLTDDQIELLTR
jgi:hypothetical protein